MERIYLRDDKMEHVQKNCDMEEREKSQVLRAKRTRSTGDVLEEAEVLIDQHSFYAFSETKSSLFLKRIITNQSMIETNIIKTWEASKCTPKTKKVIREIREILLCREGKGTRHLEKCGDKILVKQNGLPLNAKHIVSCCKRVSSEIQSRHDIVANVLLNNILVQRGLISNEQM